MFTGIIAYIGKLEKKEKQLFTFSAPRDLIKKLKKGESIAVNGCCLTVINLLDNTFAVEIMQETKKHTMFGRLASGGIVNLELPVTAETLLSGHLVQGHIDGAGIIKKIKQDKNSRLLTISISQNISRYIVKKGSIGVNGISFTIIEADKDCFTVGIIPHTWKNTMLKQIKVGDLVNIETDIIAKYIEKFIKP